MYMYIVYFSGELDNEMMMHHCWVSILGVNSEIGFFHVCFKCTLVPYLFIDLINDKFYLLYEFCFV